MRLQVFLYLMLPMLAFSQNTASRQLTTFTLESQQLSGQRKIWIWLPKDYASTKKRYPVLYMHDAQTLFDAKTSFAGEWNVDETLEQLDAQVIVVGIEHGNDRRIDELTPFAHEKYNGGKADAYLDFLVSSLKPEIDKLYRTKTNAKNTAIMGSSLGGLVSFYAVLKYPGVFGKAGVFSPSFWFSEEIYAYADKSGSLKGKRFFFLCGNREDDKMVPDMLRMVSKISDKGAETTEKIIDAGEHNESLWRSNFAKAFKWLFVND